jgi:hypothetical protein
MRLTGANRDRSELTTSLADRRPTPSDERTAEGSETDLFAEGVSGNGGGEEVRGKDAADDLSNLTPEWALGLKPRASRS